MNDAEIVQAMRENRYALTRIHENAIGKLVVRDGMRVKWIGLPKDAVYADCYYSQDTRSFTFKWLHKEFEATSEYELFPFLEATCEFLPRETFDE